MINDHPMLRKHGRKWCWFRKENGKTKQYSFTEDEAESQQLANALYVKKLEEKMGLTKEQSLLKQAAKSAIETVAHLPIEQQRKQSWQFFQRDNAIKAVPQNPDVPTANIIVILPNLDIHLKLGELEQKCKSDEIAKWKKVYDEKQKQNNAKRQDAKISIKAFTEKVFALKREAGQSEKTITGQSLSWQAFLAFIKKRYIWEITPALIQAFKEKRKNELSPNSLQLTLIHIKGMLSYGVKK